MARRLFVRGIAILSLVIIAAGCAEYVLNLRTKKEKQRHSCEMPVHWR